MKPKYIILLATCFLFYCCNENKTGFEISLDSQIKLDTIYISELITDKPIAKIFDKVDNPVAIMPPIPGI